MRTGKKVSTLPVIVFAFALFSCAVPGSSTTATTTATILYVVACSSFISSPTPTTVDGSVFIAYGGPGYLSEPTGASYMTPWSASVAESAGDPILLYVQDTQSSAIIQDTITMSVYRDGTLLATRTWTNTSGSIESYTINLGVL